MEGVEPSPQGYEPRVLPLHHIAVTDKKATAGVEPALGGYEPPVLPLHHVAVTCFSGDIRS